MTNVTGGTAERLVGAKSVVRLKGWCKKGDSVEKMVQNGRCKKDSTRAHERVVINVIIKYDEIFLQLLLK